MLYLKSYKLFESIENNIDDIRNCFLHVSDLTKVKIGIIKGHFLGVTGIEVSIGLDHLVSDETQISKFGVEYRVVKNGDEIATLIAEAVDQCMLIDVLIYTRQMYLGKTQESGEKYPKKVLVLVI